MSIERIRADAAKADQMIMSMARGGAAVAEAEPEAPEASTEAGVQEQATEQVAAVAPTEQATPPAAPATEDNAPAVDVLEQVREESRKWEQRYRSLDGMIQARDRQIEQLTQLLSQMQQAPAKEPEPPVQRKPKVSAEEVEQFGSDLIDVQRRVAQEEVEGLQAQVAELQNLVKSMTEKLTGVESTTKATAQDTFETKLSRHFADWRQVDADPAFSTWLKAVDVRQRMFATAVQEQNAEDVAYFFKEYAASLPKPSDPAPQPKPSAQLEKQIAPGRARAVPAPAQSQTDKKQWTKSEIASFYAHGRKQYPEQEYAKLERDIFAAQREGRVDFTR